MSEFNDVLDMLDQGDCQTASTASNGIQQVPDVIPEMSTNNDIMVPGQPFNISTFVEEIRQKSENKNRAYAETKQNINGYSIGADCILSIVKRLTGHPVKSFATNWLPVLMRSTIGTSIHDFIQQNSSQFTELEPSIKVPSIRFSGRLDCLIGNNVLVEIKSVPYTDYKKIIKNQQPRETDFAQTMVYKYILENYLEEAKNPGVKTRTPPPALDCYNIDTIQMIYVAHDIMASDVENMGQALALIKEVKQMLNSKRDQFFFMTSVVLDIGNFEGCREYMNFIKDKITRINWYVDNNKLPGLDDPYIDKKACFFCQYGDQCELK